MAIQNSYNSWLARLVIICGLFSLSSCTTFSIYTQQIQATIDTNQPIQSIIVIGVSERYSFIQVNGKPLIEYQVNVFNATTNKFNYFLDPQLKNVVIYVLANQTPMISYYLEQAISFNKIKVLELKLEKDERWADSYYFNIKPFIHSLLNNEKYFISPYDKISLVNWLIEVEPKEIMLRD